MRVAILMGITYAGSAIPELPLCKNDLQSINKIIDSTGLYQEKLILDDNYSKARDALEKLTEFVEDLEKRKEEIDEVFVYYTGHGGIINEEFYFGWNDYSSVSPASTSIVNSQFDDLIRRLQAKLTVKFIDSCHSGMPYVKDMVPITFKDCFFCFSCRNNQSSGFENGYSSFTYSIFEAISKCLENKNIRYRDIVNFITDKYTPHTDNDEDQRPYFVTQGTNTNIFCDVSDSLKNVINEILNIDSISESSSEKDEEIDPFCMYGEIIKKLDSKFMNDTQIKQLSLDIQNSVKKTKLIDNLAKLNFNINVSSGKIDDSIPCFNQLCYFVDRECCKYSI